MSNLMGVIITTALYMAIFVGCWLLLVGVGALLNKWEKRRGP